MNIIAQHLWDIKHMPEWQENMATAIEFIGDSITGTTIEEQDRLLAGLTEMKEQDLRSRMTDNTKPDAYATDLRRCEEDRSHLQRHMQQPSNKQVRDYFGQPLPLIILLQSVLMPEALLLKPLLQLLPSTLPSINHFENGTQNRYTDNPDIARGWVMKVHDARQGCPKSARLWALLIDKVIRELGLRPCTHEPNLYYCSNYQSTGNLFLFLSG